MRAIPRTPALTLCLITDRLRLAAACGRPPHLAARVLLEQVAGAIAGGVDVIHVRERDLAAREQVRLVRECVALAAGTPTRVVVNDRVDVALAAAADGVHLRETSIDLHDARRLLGAAAWLGRSVHSPETAAREAAADYLIAGNVFATASKPNLRTALGIDGLRAIVHAAGECPVWAIGGITSSNAGEVAQSGARGVAAIGAFTPSIAAGDRTSIAHAAEKLTELLRFCFDSSPGLL